MTVTAVLWFCQLAVSVPAEAAGTATTEVTLASGRSYYLHYRPGDITPKPLIVILHGFGGSAANVAGTTGLIPWSDARGNDVNIAFPEGIDSEWNAGSFSADLGCCGGSQARDVSYLRDVAISVGSMTPTALVYVWGFSNGGMMAIRAVCQAPKIFFAAATVEAGAAVHCGGPVRIVSIHQTRDATVKYGGGPVVFGGSVIGHTLPDQAASFPIGTDFDQHLCTQAAASNTYHSWTSPCWPTTGQVNDLLWSSLTGTTSPQRQ